MEYVKFKKNGLYSKEYDESNDVATWSKASGPIYLYFQSVVEIDTQLTLGDLMRILIQYEADIDAMFLGCTRGNRLRPYYEEMMLPPASKRDDLSHVEISWVADYYKADSFNHENELYLGLQVSGVSKKSEEATYHALSRAKLNDWKHLRVELHDTMVVNEFIMNDSARTTMHVVTLLEARKEVTLYDFVAGILTELTMYGYPEQREEKIMDINKLMHDSGVSKEVLHQKEDELSNAISLEDYELAAVLKREIDNIKKLMHGS